MTQAELVTQIAKEAKISKKAAKAALSSLVRAIQESLKAKNGAIRISDLGTFKVARRKARAGVNPRTLQKIKIPASKVPSFRASNALKESASGEGKHGTGMRSKMSSAVGVLMCKVCGLPAVGELPFCKAHQKTAC